jgi:hypothetical protein
MLKKGERREGGREKGGRRYLRIPPFGRILENKGKLLGFHS